MSPIAPPDHEDLQRAERLRSACQRIREEVGKLVVGQEETIEQLLIAILSRGHCLLQGVPGLAKTLMVRSLAEAIDLTFHRIQFTPDLMPADITGTD
ncbi:MAG: AAA family ATPase, partial [bacterium]